MNKNIDSFKVEAHMKQILKITSGRKRVLHKDENCPLGAELDPLTNHINKLPNSQISWDKVSAVQTKKKKKREENLH